ncbi:Peptidyl-prolyl cis-trans isomerase CWC27 like protein [Eufriesea mexicana]|uniref:Spliceosome-associated protein CWC27 homolog n=1 Tax=Eufriesea mexicana TaxID=516756 RepID=A0A310SQ29_9HYME|nr:Peptidyl-prolyl cis-trans isomerase CWC27 like protein [Eufriesea mexicana]
MKERIKNKLKDPKKEPKQADNCKIDDAEDDKEIDVWFPHANMRTIGEMENEQSMIVIESKDKLNIKCKCCIKAQMCRNIYRNMEKVKAARIIGLWHMELIGPVKLMLKGHKGNLQTRLIFICKSQSLRVVMKTTVGDIEAELWVKETPKTCRNFIQLCMEGYWDNNIFHTQGGDPTDTGESCKIYGEPFKDDFRTRLRSCGRGLIAGGYAGEDDNGFQFLFTLGSTLELHNKHTIFCKGTGQTIYNMLELEEALVDENARPFYPPRLIKIMILNNPFSDITPRIIVQKSEEVKDSSKTKTTAVKGFNLLSFVEEAGEDEKEYVILNKKFSGKGKSTHGHLTDTKLSSQPAVEPPGLANKKRKDGRSSDWENDDKVKTQEELEVVRKEKVAMKKRIKNTLRATKKEPKKVQNYKIDDVEDDKASTSFCGGGCLNNLGPYAYRLKGDLLTLAKGRLEFIGVEGAKEYSRRFWCLFSDCILGNSVINSKNRETSTPTFDDLEADAREDDVELCKFTKVWCSGKKHRQTDEKFHGVAKRLRFQRCEVTRAKQNARNV